MMTKKKKKIYVFSIFTFIFAAAAAILDIFSQYSFWKPNPGGGGGSTSIITSGQDRISELPVGILHRILGYLEMDEFLIRTSLVSKQWRNLWKSVSTLNFSHGNNNSSSTRISGSCVDNGGGGIKNNVETYQNFVDHVLRLRDSQASKIQIFNYSCFSRLRGYDYSESLHSFVVSAVNQGAREIQIKGFYLNETSNMIHFNPSIFTSGLLRKFTFYVYNRNSLIQFPRSMCCATQLTHLSLDGIRLPEGDDSNAAELHLVCPVLETFCMRCCYSEHLKVLDISAPRLNSLSICNYGMRDGHFNGLGGCRIEIRTPNLISLLYSGCVYVDCFMGNLPRVVFACLTFMEETGMMEETTSFAIKLLKGLTTAQSLTLEGFEVFPEDLLKELLTPFTSLRTLMLSTSCEISSIHGMVHFLNSCSSVEKLIWAWE